MNIEIFSDLICPWCFIGKKRLDQALSTEAGEGVDVIWRAFQLYPGIPADGMPRDEFLRQRYGSSGGGGSGRSQIEIEADQLGINMQFNRIERMPNTLKGHRLLHGARQYGVQHELAEILFRGYFEQGKDLGDDDVLLQSAVESGMPRARSESLLATEEGTEAVLAEIERASNIGVSGVPCFILAGAFALPGAQDAAVMGQFIKRAKAKLAEAV